MNMIRMITERGVQALIITLALYLSGCGWSDDKKVRVALRTFPVDSGWGYEIRAGERRLIYQPTIPALDSIRSFPSEASAKRVGRLVLERVVSGQRYALTENEVKAAFGE